MEVAVADFVAVFGQESRGATQEERARTSRRRFVRTQDHLFVIDPGVQAPAMSAFEALSYFGFSKLLEAVEFGSAILVPSAEEPARTLRERRFLLGLSEKDVAKAAGLQVEVVVGAENPRNRTRYESLAQMAVPLALNERLLGVVPGAGGDASLGARLKSVGLRGRRRTEALDGGADERFTPRLVTALAEAAWVVVTQSRLQEWRGVELESSDSFPRSSNYGDPTYPAWRHGFYLAQETRRRLGIPSIEPIPSMRDVYEQLRIPLVEMALPGRVSGATIADSGVRGVVVSTEGDTENVWVRRATLAHELGHLLWDPEEHLQAVRVDDEDWKERPPWLERDHVEARANAFAVEFLAPTFAVESLFRENPAQGVRRVMEHFGISRTAARYHIWNAMERAIPFDSLAADDPKPSQEWIAREEYTTIYFPLKTAPLSRRGEFAGMVAAAERDGLLTPESASNYLCSSVSDYVDVVDSILQIFSHHSK